MQKAQQSYHQAQYFGDLSQLTFGNKKAKGKILHRQKMKHTSYSP